jgi:NitT/TauT family transport system ATP-binding protein
LEEENGDSPKQVITFHMTELLEIINVCKAFGSNSELEVLNNISLTVGRGEFVCVVGPNGCGKTTLLEIVAGFETPSSGSVYIGGKPVLGPNPSHPLILQDLGLFHWMTVWNNLIFGLKAAHKNTEDAEKVAKLWLAKLGLEGFEKHYPFELSGGMKQKLAIARALILEPDVLLMDEPFAGLDMLTREKMQEEVGEIAALSGKTSLMTTHSLEEAVFLSDRVVVMTERPAKVRDVVPIPFARPRRSELRLTQQFSDVKGRIWQSLCSTSKEV